MSRPGGRRPALGVALALGLSAASLSWAAARRHPVRRVVVTGDSMRPTFEPGDRVLLGPAWRVRPGQVVGLADPRQPDRLMIKRVRSIDSSGIRVEGDNPGASTDSRHYGPVTRTYLIGRVLYRYAPLARAGWWPDSRGSGYKQLAPRAGPGCPRSQHFGQPV